MNPIKFIDRASTNETAPMHLRNLFQPLKYPGTDYEKNRNHVHGNDRKWCEEAQQ